jgi:hypothetical protein
MIGKVPGKSHLEHFIIAVMTNSSKTSEVLREHEGNGQDFVGQVHTGMHTAASAVGIVPYTPTSTTGRRDGTRETTGIGYSSHRRARPGVLVNNISVGCFLENEKQPLCCFQKKVGCSWLLAC